MKKFFCFFIFTSSLSFAQKEINLDEIVFQSEQEEGIFNEEISIKNAINTPNLTGSLTDILKTLPYVSVNTELSSQYMVRGGNYDENLIYINGIEIYKPQLVRSGEQEGLSLLNPKMAAHVNFMAGGWEAQFGDKLSSALDVIYRSPVKKSLDLSASLLGGDITIGTPFKNGSAIIGARYLNRNLILNTLDQDTEFNPESYDIQTFLNYKITPEFNISWLGNFNSNKFNQIPNSRTTHFGTLEKPILVSAYYQGNEQDKFQTEFSNLGLTYQLNNLLNLSLDLFTTHTTESEHFDILGAYFINSTDESKNTTSSTDIGGQIDYGRNDLDALIYGIQHRGNFKLDKNKKISWGIKIQQEDLKDRVNEWQMIDSTGYSVRPFSNTYTSIFDISNKDLSLNYSIQGKNHLTSNRYSSFVQYNSKFFINKAKILLNAGIRLGYWDFNSELNLSPRFQIAIKPDWVTSQLFRLSIGRYVQPPFYKELKRLDGSVNQNIKSQKSIHFLGGHDFEFFLWDRPFKLSTDIYYKHLTDLIPYYVDNVRLKYSGENNSRGFAYGIDLRMFGELIPGADSWLSLSYAKTKENINNNGWIDRPTDPKFKASLFFQDYMPAFPSFKVNLNLIYATGLPNGAPPFTDPYQFQTRLPDYKRVDIGLIKEFSIGKKKENKTIKSLEFGINIFNLFDISNVISNQWLRDVESNRIYGVPNRLTGRFFNANINVKF